MVLFVKIIHWEAPLIGRLEPKKKCVKRRGKSLIFKKRWCKIKSSYLDNLHFPCPRRSSGWGF